MLLKYKAIKFTQGQKSLYLFSAKSKDIWAFSSINQKTDDKAEGYQRTLSPSRAKDIKRYISDGNTIAPAIILSLDEKKTSFNESTSEIIIENFGDAAWVIDGQHRLRGASLLDEDKDIELPIVAYMGLDIGEQILQFVTINKEAKGVPTSLYYDLLSSLPTRTKPADIAKEKAADIGNFLRKKEDSIFFDKIVVVTSPRKGQLSLNNFVRKIYPLVLDKGPFCNYSQQEFIQILENYFKALKLVFPDEFSIYKERFFQTLGFGAAINALNAIFLITIKEQPGFRVEDIQLMLNEVSSFRFSDWDNIGTGNAAETLAGRDFEEAFKNSIQDKGTGKMVRLF